MADWIDATGTNSGSGTATDITSFTTLASYAHGSTDYDDFKIFITITGLNTGAENELTFRLEDSSNNLVFAEETVTVPTADDVFTWQSSQVTLSANDTYSVKVKSGNASDTSIAYSYTFKSPNTANAAIETYGLDHLVSASVTGTDVADNSIIAKIVSKSATADWDSYSNQTDSLEVLSDGGIGTGLVNLVAAHAADNLGIDNTVKSAMQDYGLDHLISAAVLDTDVADNSIIAKMCDDGATADFTGFDNTEDSLRGSRIAIEANTSTVSSALAVAIPNLVWEEPQSGHVTAGTFGAYLDSSVSTIDSLIDGIIAGTSKVTPIDADGVAFDDAISAMMATMFGVATVSSGVVSFKARDGSTEKVSVTVGSTDGTRTASTIA